jgi:hypothetical protein
VEPEGFASIAACREPDELNEMPVPGLLTVLGPTPAITESRPAVGP